MFEGLVNGFLFNHAFVAFTILIFIAACVMVAVGKKKNQKSMRVIAYIAMGVCINVQNNGWGGPSLSASIGVSFGVLGVSLSVPVSFSGSYTVDINDTYEGYVNGRDGNYTRSIRTAMKSNYKLTQIGYYFEVRSTIADFGNVTKASAYHKATWDLTIINAGDMSTQGKTITQNVPIAIQN